MTSTVHPSLSQTRTPTHTHTQPNQQVEIIPPPRVVVDLSQFGPKDSTVVKLPDVKINISNPVQILHDPPKVRVSVFLAAGGAREPGRSRACFDAVCSGALVDSRRTD